MTNLLNIKDAEGYPVWVAQNEYDKERDVPCAKPDIMHRSSFAYGYQAALYDVRTYAGIKFICSVCWYKIKRFMKE